MPDYDSFLFKPPAPVAFITLINPENGLEKPRVLMLLDTAADITLIPKFSTDNLDLDFSQSQQIRLEAFDGKKSLSQSVDLFLLFEEQKFRGSFPLVEQSFGIIGRNILNKFKIELDGQNLRWKIL